MADAVHDQTAEVATHASMKLVSDVSAHGVQEMTERMTDLKVESAVRYFNGDVKAALAAQAVLLRQMAGDCMGPRRGAELVNRVYFAATRELSRGYA